MKQASLRREMEIIQLQSNEIIFKANGIIGALMPNIGFCFDRVESSGYFLVSPLQIIEQMTWHCFPIVFFLKVRDATGQTVLQQYKVLKHKKLKSSYKEQISHALNL